MSTKLILALTLAAAVLVVPRSEARTPADAPTPASIAAALERAGAPAHRIVALNCEHRPSALFGDQVFRCRVSAHRPAEAPAPVQMTLTLAALDGGWAIVAR